LNTAGENYTSISLADLRSSEYICGDEVFDLQLAKGQWPEPMATIQVK